MMKGTKPMQKKIVMLLLIGALTLSTLMVGCGKKDIKDVTTKDIENMSEEELEDYLEETLEDDKDADKPSKAETEKPKITYKKHDADAMWNTSMTYGEGTQILDVYIHQGEKMKDVIKSLEKSKYKWEYTYNPKATVSDEKGLDVSLDGDKWFNIQMINFTNESEIIQDEANVIFVNISYYGEAQENVRTFKDYFAKDIKKMSMEDLKNLKATMFATLPIVNVEEEQSDTTATYTYEVYYPIVLDMEGKKLQVNDLNTDGKFCVISKYTFTHDLETKETSVKSYSMYKHYQNSELDKVNGN